MKWKPVSTIFLYCPALTVAHHSPFLHQMLNWHTKWIAIASKFKDKRQSLLISIPQVPSIETMTNIWLPSNQPLRIRGQQQLNQKYLVFPFLKVKCSNWKKKKKSGINKTSLLLSTVGPKCMAQINNPQDRFEEAVEQQWAKSRCNLTLVFHFRMSY